jgi:hypothetical protein
MHATRSRVVAVSADLAQAKVGGLHSPSICRGPARLHSAGVVFLVRASESVDFDQIR